MSHQSAPRSRRAVAALAFAGLLAGRGRYRGADARRRAAFSRREAAFARREAEFAQREAAFTRRKAEFAQREADADALLREHAALHAVAALVARGDALAEVCDRVAASAADLLDAEVALVLRFDPDGRGILAGRSVRHITNFPDVGEELKFEAGSALGQVRVTRRTARVAVGAPSPFMQQLGERVAAPIELDAALWGAVAVGGTRERPLPADSESRLESFAELVALAIGNAEARAKLIAHATTDPLTGAANRRAFDQRLQSEVERAHRYHRPLSLAVFDVDRFKSINDTAGHLAGDAVLVEVARRIAGALRPDALVGRLGGDEFAAVLPESDAATAKAIAERALQAVSAAPVAALKRVTVSAGVSDLQTADCAQALFERADRALYLAKGGGRGVCMSYPPQPAVWDGPPLPSVV